MKWKVVIRDEDLKDANPSESPHHPERLISQGDMGRFPDNKIEISGGIIRDKNLHGNLPARCLQVNHLIPSSVKDAGDDPLENVMPEGFLHRLPLSYDHDLFRSDKEVHLILYASGIQQMGHRQGEVETVDRQGYPFRVIVSFHNFGPVDIIRSQEKSHLLGGWP